MVVAYFMILFQNLCEGTEENHEKIVIKLLWSQNKPENSCERCIIPAEELLSSVILLLLLLFKSHATSIV